MVLATILGILLFIDLNETLVIPRLCNLSAHNLHVKRLAAGRLRAACRALEVDRGRRGKKTPFIIALAALVLLTMAPAMVQPVARHIVFFKALRKPATSSVPWAMKTRATVMTADPCVVLPKTGVAVSSLHCPGPRRPLWKGQNADDQVRQNAQSDDCSRGAAARWGTAH